MYLKKYIVLHLSQRTPVQTGIGVYPQTLVRPASTPQFKNSRDSRRKAAKSATLAIVNQFSNVKDFFAEQAKDLNPGIRILMQQAQEFLARNEL